MSASEPGRANGTAPHRAEVRAATRRIRTTALGPENPLPPIVGAADLHEQISTDGLDAEMARGLSYGKVATVLPYLMQDAYGRDLTEQQLPTAVLENDAIRAEFLTGLGGRLWSLTDKRSGRELLHTPETLRPANLALRNAWFAGGVEWNLGTTGHWPLTCSPLHAARVERADGTVGLRLYEYERMRGLLLRIDASLPEDAALLAVTITIENPHQHTVPVYWWSNTAVPEHPDVRVVTPAASAWHFGYSRRLEHVPYPLPAADGADRSYTTRADGAADYFFDLDDPAGRATLAFPWIAALDGEGCGLFQASSRRLRGRKLFHWGTGPGGAHWQDWLGDGAARYLEIQAGLARTQLEHLPMPAGARWRWTEVYGPARADADAVHGAAWSDAVDAAASAVRAAGAARVLAHEEARDERGDRITRFLSRGSGWGALEDARRRAVGAAPLSSAAAPFLAEDLGEAQAYWLDLLNFDRPADPTSSVSAPVDAAPLSYQADAAWLPALTRRGDGLARLHAGVIRAAAGDLDTATTDWRASVAASENGWAHRCLAVAARARGDAATAAAESAVARRLLPDLVPLAIESVAGLVATSRHADALAAIEGLPDAVRATGRIRFAEASAALALGDLERCGAILESGIEIPDLREGELSLDRLWVDYHVRMLAAASPDTDPEELRARAVREHPIPRRYDFRMEAGA